MVKTTDIKSAFLQGKTLDRDVYLIPPKEAHTERGKLWKLKHCLYGLNDAARQFYASVVEVLKSLGCKQSKLDPALFYFWMNGKLAGVIGSHIDDFLHAGDDSFEYVVMEKLRDRFLAGKVESSNFRYVGYQVTQNNGCLVLNQDDYAKSITVENVPANRLSNKSDKLNQLESTQLRSLAGKLNWLVQGTRPDLAFELVELSMQFKKGDVSDWMKGVKAIKKAQTSDCSVCFPMLGDMKDWKIIVFSDAALANLSDGKSSTGAHIVMLVGVNKLCCPLAWQANKIKRIVRSTIAAEALSLLQGLENAIYLRALMSEVLGCDANVVKIIAYVDNKSVVEAVYSTKQVDDKKLRIDLGAIKECVDRGEVSSVRWCPGDKQLANCLTKRGASSHMILDILHTGVLNIPGLDL